MEGLPQNPYGPRLRLLGLMSDAAPSNEELAARLAHVEAELARLRGSADPLNGLRGEEAVREVVRRIRAWMTSHKVFDTVEFAAGTRIPFNYVDAGAERLAQEGWLTEIEDER